MKFNLYFILSICFLSLWVISDSKGVCVFVQSTAEQHCLFCGFARAHKPLSFHTGLGNLKDIVFITVGIYSFSLGNLYCNMAA